EIVRRQSKPEQFTDPLFKSRPYGVTLVILQRHDALVLEIIETDAVVAMFGAAGDAEVLIRDISLLEQQLLPIGVYTVILIQGVGMNGSAGGRIIGLPQGYELRPVHHRVFSPDLFDPGIPIIGEPGLLSKRAFIRRDQYYAVGAARTINSGRRGILEDIDTLDLAGTDVAEIPDIGYAVQYDQWVIGGVQRPRTPDTDLHPGAGLGGGLRHFDARHTSLQSPRNIHGRHLVHFIPGDRCYGTRDILSTLRPIADDHHLIEAILTGLQDNIDRPCPGLNFPGRKTHMGYDKGGFGGNRDRKITVRVRRHAIICIFYSNRRAGEGSVLFIQYASFYRQCALRRQGHA